MLQRLLSLLILLFALVISIEARGKLQGIAGQGAQTVNTSGISSSTTHIKTYPGCTVTVYRAGTTQLALIYSDNSSTVKANPFTSSTSDASWFFYADNGHYDVKFSGTGITTQFTVGDFVLTDLGYDVFNVRAYGALGNGRISHKGVSTSSSAVVACSDCNFASEDVGKIIREDQAGTALGIQFREVVSTIASVQSSTQATMAATASRSASNLTVTIGVSDDTAIQNAVNAAVTAGGGVYVPAGIYLINDINATGSIAFFRGDGASTIFVRDGQANSGGLVGYGPGFNFSPVIDTYAASRKAGSAAITVGTNTFTLNNVSGLSIGDRVYLWLGDDPSDCCRTGAQFSYFSTITNISGSVITVSNPVPEAITSLVGIADGSSSDNPKQHHVFKVSSPLEGLDVGNYTIDATGTSLATNMLSILYASNVHVHDIYAPVIYGTQVLNVYSDNVTVERIHGGKSLYDTTNCVLGSWIAGWSLNNYVARDSIGEDITGPAYSFELHNRNILVENTRVARGSTPACFPQFINILGGTKEFLVRNSTFISNSTITGVDGLLAEDISVWFPTASAGFNYHTNIARGYIEVNGTKYEKHKFWTKTMTLVASTDNAFNLPKGVPVRLRVYVSSATGITSGIRLSTPYGSNPGQGTLVSGHTVEWNAQGHYQIYMQTSNTSPPDSGFQFIVPTDSTLGGGTTMTVQYEYLSTTDDETGNVLAP